jgi:hypothetical protein
MIRKKADDNKETTIEIQEIEMVTADFYVLGTKPLIMNRLGEKARQELLLPARKKNRAERETTLKHDPIAEYRSALNQFSNDDHPTRLYMPGRAFALAMASAALDIPGASKSEIGRLTQVTDIQVPTWGKPELFLDVVRLAGIVKTPDIRSRGLLKKWACKLTVRYMKNKLTLSSVARLLAASGTIIGVGDYRLQKSGAYGEFKLVTNDDPEWQEIVNTQGREAQDEAIENPDAYDDSTRELFSWFEAEAERREKTPTSSRGNGDRKPKSRIREYKNA